LLILFRQRQLKSNNRILSIKVCICKSFKNKLFFKVKYGSITFVNKRVNLIFFLQIWFQFRLIWIADNCELQKWPSNKESTTPTGQRQGEQTRWKIYPSRVIFINFLRSAFAHSDPKSTKKTDGLTVFFALIRSGLIKADYWMLMKLNPIENSLKKLDHF
jgi:hypothetical protein